MREKLDVKFITIIINDTRTFFVVLSNIKYYIEKIFSILNIIKYKIYIFYLAYISHEIV